MSAFIINKPEKTANTGKETLIDMINQAEKVPLYFVTNELLCEHQAHVVSQSSSGTGGEMKSYATCKEMEGTSPLPSAFDQSKEMVISELNRVFKTDKFILKDASEIPSTEKKGMTGLMFGRITAKLQPELKSFDFSGIKDPIFVFCSMAGVYSSPALLDNGTISKADMKEYKTAGIEAKPEIDIFLTNYLNVRLLYVDPKNGEAKYADPMVFNIESKSEKTAKMSECVTAIDQLTSQLEPGSEAESFTGKIIHMFDEFAVKQWKKQK